MLNNNKDLKTKLVSQISMLIMGILIVPTIVIVMLIYQNINYNNLIKQNIGKEIQQIAKVYSTNIEKDIQKYTTLFNILSLINDPNSLDFNNDTMNIEEIYKTEELEKRYGVESIPYGGNIFTNKIGGNLVINGSVETTAKSYSIVLGEKYWEELIEDHRKRKVFIFNDNLDLIYDSKSEDTYLINNELFKSKEFRDFYKEKVWGNEGYYFYDTYGKYGRNLVVSYAPIREPNTSNILGSIVILLETSKFMPDEKNTIMILFITILIGGTIFIRLIFKFSELIIKQFTKISNKFHNASKEKESIRKKLLISEKLASLGRITSGIAHEIGNPLSSILSITQILETQSLSVEQYNDFVTRIKKDAQRIDSLIKEFMHFYRDTKSNYTKLDINMVIDNAINIIPENKKEDGFYIHKDFSQNVPNILGDIKKLEIAISNIIINSIQALDKNGNICIRTYKQKNYVCISIKDNGSGISQKNIEKIFDPFYTTKPVGEGFGIGLFICQQIIEAHDGIIKAISREGKGTEFIIKLPFSENMGEN